MKAPSPAFSLYPKDLLSDEACVSMNNEEFGAYVRLLLFAWLEGSIPKDLTRLARLLGVGGRTMGRLWRAIEPCWHTDPNDPTRLRQKRLEEIRQQQVATSEAQRLRVSGRYKSNTFNKSAVPRYGSGSHPVVPDTYLPFPSPFPITEVQHGTSVKTSDTSPTAPVGGPRKRASKQKPDGSPRTTWLTPYGEVWSDRWDVDGGPKSVPPYPHWAKVLRPVWEAQGGDAVLLPAFRSFLQQATSSRFATMEAFVAGLGEWASPAVPAAQGPRSTAQDKTDAAFRVVAQRMVKP